MTRVSFLVLFTCVSVYVLTLSWSIILLKCIAKIPVDNGFNHGMRSAVSLVFKSYSIVKVNVVDIWWLYIRRSNFPKSSS